MKVKITERGWGAHYICSGRCRFRRNTLLECGDRRVIVSTVGAMPATESASLVQPLKEFETIGDGRYYETMVFTAKRTQEVYWDADIRQRLTFQSPWKISDMTEASDLRANDMHEAVVAEIAGKLARGEPLRRA